MDTPPGEGAIGDPTTTPQVPGLLTSVSNLALGVGSFGCGFDSQNEAWYRSPPRPWPTASPA
jgi:hypothetical protein